MNTQNQIKVKWYETLTVKMILLGIMAIMLLIPLQLIRHVISERSDYSEDVKTEISEHWGTRQLITGPVLNIPVYPLDTDMKNTVNQARTWHILPEELHISANIDPQVRSKGIYKTIIYTLDLVLNGNFLIPSHERLKNYQIAWDEAYLTLGISDNLGISGDVILLSEDEKKSAEPGLKDKDLFSSGITFPVTINLNEYHSDFNIKFSLRGSEGVYFTPAGKNTDIGIRSTWEDPSFNGKFLPVTREINKDGFSARWEITHLNRNIPNDWIGPLHDITEEACGVDLILELDHYQKSERSIKYGLLFITLTFLVLLFIELSSKKSIHIFSYFLVALALILFFSLLTAFSEHLDFRFAYLVASLSTVSLITVFFGKLTKSVKASFSICALLSVLYTFLYFLLSLNEYAFVAGNTGLFIALAAIMFFSTKKGILKKI